MVFSFCNIVCLGNCSCHLLKSLISISNKAAKQWILEVELPTSAPEELKNFIDKNGKYNEPDVISGTQLFYSLVLENLKDIITE